MTANTISCRGAVTPPDLTEAALDCPTPSLLFSRSKIRSNCVYFADLVRSSFGDHPVCLFFSVKTAHHPLVLQELQQHELGAEVICQKELESARNTGFRTILVDGPVKPDKFLYDAISKGVRYVSVDGLPQIADIDRVAQECEVVQKLLVRMKVAPNRRLGIRHEDVSTLAVNLEGLSNVEFCGFHIHPGSNVSTKAAEQAYTALFAAEDIAQKHGLQPSVRNLGSGFPTISTGREAIRLRLQFIMHRGRITPAETILEPGRPLVGDAAILCARISQVRDQERLVVVDTAVTVIAESCAGTPCLLHWCAKSRQWRQVSMARKGDGWALAGIWPSEADLLWVQFPQRPLRGDRVIWCQAGAYALGFVSEFALDGELCVSVL